MIMLFLFTAAICLTVAGHIFKVKRWNLLISVYEKADFGNLLSSLALGQTINALLPIRVGDICRIVHSGKKLKNSYSLSIATVLVDLYFDLLCVGIMMITFFALGTGGKGVEKAAFVYIILLVIAVCLTVFGILFRKCIKQIIRCVAGIFNENIEYEVLFLSYLTIASLKDLVKKISKVKFVCFTILMWINYICSYQLFALFLNKCSEKNAFVEVFTTLFSGASLYRIQGKIIVAWIAFLIVPLFICWGISFLFRKKAVTAGTSHAVLPQMSQTDKLAFLRIYYKEENREHLQGYLAINSDVLVIEDNSAGSNASTVSVMKDGNIYYRKYAFDDDGKKLLEQINWIEEHQENIPLPIVVSKRYQDNYCTYDMHNYSSAIGMFKFIHTMPLEESWKVLESALNDIRSNLHNMNVKPADSRTIQQYIQSKVEKNLKIIGETSHLIKKLERYDYIVVNGKKLRTLKFYDTMFDDNHLNDIFKNDFYSDIHGDLTIENIVCLKEQSEIDMEEYVGKITPGSYYFIDPNTGNLHDSPFLDYAKLLQSLHGNYEFLMMVNKVNMKDNYIDFLMPKSEAYVRIYEKFKHWIQDSFNKEQVISIYYHEIIHWLRLMPYKIRKNEKLAVVFYAGMLQVLADVWEMENSEK